MNQEEVLQQVVDIAKEAGTILTTFFQGSYDTTVKTRKNDVVTDADHASEKYIVSQIQEHFPNDAILAEESGTHGDDSAEYRWLIDPLDGTYNFVRHDPKFGVMITRLRNDQPDIAVIYTPIEEDLATVICGEPTQLNGEVVQLDLDVSFESARAILPIIGHWEEHIDTQHIQTLTEYFLQKEPPIGNMYTMAGSVTRILAGKYDMLSINADFAWDRMPMSALLSGSGLTVTDFTGAPLDWRIEQQSHLSAPPKLHQELLALLKS